MHPIDQQEGKAMRQRLEDCRDIRSFKGRCGTHTAILLIVGGRIGLPSRMCCLASRSTSIISRNHCLIGLAKATVLRSGRHVAMDDAGGRNLSSVSDRDVVVYPRAR